MVEFESSNPDLGINVGAGQQLSDLVKGNNDAIQRALGSESEPPRFTKPVGCPIPALSEDRACGTGCCNSSNSNSTL